MQDRDPGHDRKDAAVAPEDAVFDLVAVPAVEQGGDELEAAATERAAENVERRDVHRQPLGANRRVRPGVSMVPRPG